MTENNLNLENRYDNEDHWALHDQKKSRSRCKMPECTFFSSYYCSKCEFHLCMTPKRNCFYTFHCPSTESIQTKQPQSKNLASHVKDNQTRSVRCGMLSQKDGIKKNNVGKKKHTPRNRSNKGKVQTCGSKSLAKGVADSIQTKPPQSKNLANHVKDKQTKSVGCGMLSQKDGRNKKNVGKKTHTPPNRSNKAKVQSHGSLNQNDAQYKSVRHHQKKFTEEQISSRPNPFSSNDMVHFMKMLDLVPVKSSI